MKKYNLPFVLIFISLSVISQDTYKKNSLVIESNFIASTNFSYDRVLKLNDNFSLLGGADYILGVGFGYGSHWISPEIGLRVFGPKHFFETGVLYVIEVFKVEQSDSGLSPGAQFAYHYVNQMGLSIRLRLSYLSQIDPLVFPSIGLGYAF